MSVDLTYYIEFKDKEDSEWKLLSYLIPKHKKRYYRDEDDEDTAVLDDGRKYELVYQDSIQGTPRNLFSENEEISGRGFPTDISEELDKILKKEYEKYAVDYGDGEKRDWRWGKSYALLSELYSIFKQEYNEAFERYMKRRMDSRFDYINSRFDRMERLLEQKKVAKLKPFEKEEEWFDDEDSWEKESLNDAMWFGNWLYSIKERVNFSTDGWYNSEEIRIIVYLS